MPVEIVYEIQPRALQYADKPQWHDVIARAQYQGCGNLALVARILLMARDRVQALIGTVVAVPFSGPEREYARQLAQRIPLGFNEALVAAARGLQLTGIFACVSNGVPLTNCACYLDIVEKEVQPMLNRLLAECGKDWTGLADLTVE